MRLPFVSFLSRAALAAIASWPLVGCESGTEAPSPPHLVAEPVSELSPAALRKRGEELVALGGCGDCHTPMKLDPALGMPVPDLTLRLSGHPSHAPAPAAQPGQGDQAVIGSTFTSFRLPFGVVYAANLTPDRETGLGDWTLEEFVQTMRTGQHRGTGRAVLPPMPWQNLQHQPDQDLAAIFAYLQSLPAVTNRVPKAQVPDAVIAHIGATKARLHPGEPSVHERAATETL